MDRLREFLRVAVVSTALMLIVCVDTLPTSPASAAGLAAELRLAAVASPQETEKQRETRLVEGAKKEGKVVYWDAGGSAKEWEQLFSKFRQKYPFLVVEHWRASDAEVYQKITTEARAGVYNVDIAGVEINLVSELQKTGLMKKYSWPNTAAWSAQHKDRDGYWIARNITCVAVTYNTNLVSPAEAPKAWDDLLHPKWKGAISMDKDGSDWVLMLWSAWGKEKTVNYLKNLARNNVALGAGVTARTEMLSAGAFKVDLRLNLERVLDYQKKGAPLEWVRTDPMLAKLTQIYLSERAPHPNAALLYADWFTSFEGQQAFYEAGGRLVSDPRIKTRVGDALQGLRVVVSSAELAEHGTEAERIWRDIFLK
jgi:iron(III) transport system substrate-binding protein